MKTNQPPYPVHLDTLLTLEEAAALWRMRPKELSARSKGRGAKIPGIWINARVVRFHPRMMFAKVARDNGVPIDVIMGALNLRSEDATAIGAQLPLPKTRPWWRLQAGEQTVGGSRTAGVSLPSGCNN